jgi:1,4-dihydroxy-2-naphthoyl-CoA hydrolase
MRMSGGADQSSDHLARVLSMGMGALNERMGIELIEVTSERVVGTMPVDGNTQPIGLLHGGASVVLAESLGSVGAGIRAYPDRVPVGVDINATHHRAVRSGSVTGIATALHVGRRMSTWNVSIRDDEDRPVCTARITCALIPAQETT